MNKNILLLGVFALSLGISGCAEDRPTLQRGPWELKATKHTKEKTLGYKGNQIELSDNQKMNLKKLTTQSSLPGPLYARVIVNAPIITEDNQNRAAQIFNHLTGLGVDRLRIDVEHVSPSDAYKKEKQGMETITVAIDQYHVIEPICPGWDEPMNFRTPPEGEANFGCANARNLFHMVADPRDIYMAQQLAPGDGPRNRWPMERLRKDKLKELIQESYAAGGGAGGGSSAVTVNTGSPGGGGASGDSGY